MKALVLKDVGLFEVHDVPEPKIFPENVRKCQDNVQSINSVLIINLRSGR
jgi:hypothetical protein